MATLFFLAWGWASRTSLQSHGFLASCSLNSNQASLGEELVDEPFWRKGQGGDPSIEALVNKRCLRLLTQAGGDTPVEALATLVGYRADYCLFLLTRGVTSKDPPDRHHFYLAVHDDGDEEVLDGFEAKAAVRAYEAKYTRAAVVCDGMQPEPNEFLKQTKGLARILPLEWPSLEPSGEHPQPAYEKYWRDFSEAHAGEYVHVTVKVSPAAPPPPPNT